MPAYGVAVGGKEVRRGFANIRLSNSGNSSERLKKFARVGAFAVATRCHARFELFDLDAQQRGTAVPG